MRKQEIDPIGKCKQRVDFTWIGPARWIGIQILNWLLICEVLVAQISNQTFHCTQETNYVREEQAKSSAQKPHLI